MKRHKSEKNYDCDDCDKKFITNADLLRFLPPLLILKFDA